MKRYIRFDIRMRTERRESVSGVRIIATNSSKELRQMGPIRGRTCSKISLKQLMIVKSASRKNGCENRTKAVKSIVSVGIVDSSVRRDWPASRWLDMSGDRKREVRDEGMKPQVRVSSTLAFPKTAAIATRRRRCQIRVSEKD
jgi:hypothetical protein